MTRPKYVTITEAAIWLGRPRHEIARLVKIGGLRSYRPSGNPRGKRMIPVSELEERFGEDESSVEDPELPEW